MLEHKVIRSCRAIYRNGKELLPSDKRILLDQVLIVWNDVEDQSKGDK